jgi:aromatic-L-amino-acid decarboxylase
MPEADDKDLSALMQRASRHAVAYLEGLDQASVATTVSRAQLRARLDVPFHDAGMAAGQVIDELVEATRGGHLGSAGGRFFAWVIGGAMPSALAADWLTSAWDQNAVTYACAPAASVVEEVAGAWLKDLFDIPASASFALTTGCQMAHFTGLAAARHALLARRGWDVETDGLIGAPRIRVLVNDQRHGSIERAVRFLGLGTRAIQPLACDRDGRLAPAVLEAALGAGDGPTILVLNAADLNIGACDPYAALIPMAQAAGAWVHIDGAFGLWAKASPSRRRMVEGVELADSWATDAHKWLNTPMDSGVAFVHDAAAHRAAMTLTASYLPPPGEHRDALDWTPEWSRRARGFALYAALRELGRSGVADLIDRCCDHATALVEGVAAMPGAEGLSVPTLNQGLVRFLDPRGDDHDAETDAVIADVNATGEAFFSGVTWRGGRAMRISVCNWRTNEEDVRRALAAIRAVLETRSRAG